MTAGYIFDYGATLDTGGQHWGRALWHAYERHHVPVSEAHFREAYVYAERTLGSQHIIMPTDTFRTTLETKLRLQLDYLGGLSHRSPLTAYLSPLLEDLYASTREQTARSRDVLLQLKRAGAFGACQQLLWQSACRASRVWPRSAVLCCHRVCRGGCPQTRPSHLHPWCRGDAFDSSGSDGSGRQSGERHHACP